MDAYDSVMVVMAVSKGSLLICSLVALGSESSYIGVIGLVLRMFFFVNLVVNVLFISFFFEKDPKVELLRGGAVAVVLGPKRAGGDSFPMVGKHVELGS